MHNLTLGFILLAAGLFVVFFSLVLFYALIRVFNKLFPEKNE